jgi:tRNA A-37 threonylcarbamoyl transferase component Bud32
MFDQTRLWIAKRLADVQLHRWSDSNSVRTKCRIPGSDRLIAAGNGLMRIQGGLSECLRCREWIEWEISIAHLLDRDVRPLHHGMGITLPIIPGVSLAELLKSAASLDQKQHGIQLAGRALRDFHQQTVTACGIVDWRLSHGDATCENVIIWGNDNRAAWIDFDMRHRIHVATLDRQADDLRALIWSSAAMLESTDFPDVVEFSCQGYSDPKVIGRMREMTHQTRRPTLFQLAQAPLRRVDFERLRSTICAD